MKTIQIQIRQWANHPDYAGKPGYRDGRVILHSKQVAPDEYLLCLHRHQGWAERVYVNGAALVDVDMEPIEEPLWQEA